ncbi:hypothetical protein CLV41_11747 [Roseibium marinum]|uniref:Uncharacterized protein n=1 Tax=Roseibium marinum TaxID=281252 RepID=A0A2S3UKM4_9HYPH|nr:hypothetical protein CLV41_11747 [Roseibium marinum]
MLGELSSNEMKTPGDTAGRQSAGRKAAGDADERSHARPGLTLRIADGSEADSRAGVHLAREVHGRPIFRDIPFSEDKALTIFDKATSQPERFGLTYATPLFCSHSIELAISLALWKKYE